MTREMIERWCSSETGAPKLQRQGAQPHAEQLAAFDRHAGDCDRWLDYFLDEQLLAPEQAQRAAPLSPRHGRG